MAGQIRNGEPNMNYLNGSLDVILAQDPVNGIKRIGRTLVHVSEKEAIATLERALMYMNSDDARKAFLNVYDQTVKPVRKCGWHPAYNNGKRAVLIGNSVLEVPTDYTFKGPVSDGICTNCKKNAYEEAGLNME